jgi:hypothetical protein
VPPHPASRSTFDVIFGLDFFLKEAGTGKSPTVMTGYSLKFIERPFGKWLIQEDFALMNGLAPHKKAERIDLRFFLCSFMWG